PERLIAKPEVVVLQLGMRQRDADEVERSGRLPRRPQRAAARLSDVAVPAEPDSARRAAERAEHRARQPTDGDLRIADRARGTQCRQAIGDDDEPAHELLPAPAALRSTT